jgi:hypothetical protein
MIHGSPRTLKILFAAWIGGDELLVLHRIVSCVCMAGEPARELKNRIEGKAKPRPSYIFHKYRFTFKEEWKLKHFLL